VAPYKWLEISPSDFENAGKSSAAYGVARRKPAAINAAA
jgi:hypothetical protein